MGLAPAQQSLRGRVEDARTGAPLEKVLVTLEDAGQSALTDAHGDFELRGLTPGPHRVYVSVVGYALFRKKITVAALGSEKTAEPLIIRLSEGTTA